MLFGVMLCLSNTGCSGSGSDSPASAQPPATDPPPTQPPPSNSAPIINSAAFSVHEDTQLQDSLSASDPDGDDLSYSLVADVSNGVLLFSADGTFSYTPHPNFAGADSFTAQVSDGDLVSSTLQYSIQINPVNDAPTIQSVNKITRLDQAITFMLAAEDVDGDLLSYQIVSQPAKGIAAINQDNSVTYTPEPGSLGLDQFDVEVFDQQLKAVASVTLDNNLAYEGLISGDVDSMLGVDVLLTADGHLRKTTPDVSGRFKFYGLQDGEYALKVRKRGYRASPARRVAFDIVELNSNPDQNTNQDNVFELVALANYDFSFHWEEDNDSITR